MTEVEKQTEITNYYRLLKDAIANPRGERRELHESAERLITMMAAQPSLSPYLDTTQLLFKWRRGFALLKEKRASAETLEWWKKQCNREKTEFIIQDYTKKFAQFFKSSDEAFMKPFSLAVQHLNALQIVHEETDPSRKQSLFSLVQDTFKSVQETDDMSVENQLFEIDRSIQQRLASVFARAKNYIS